MEVIVKEDYAAVSRLAAEMIAEYLGAKPRAVLGLATGSTPVGAYRELARMNREKRVDFSKVVTFNLDEYVGLAPSHGQSYRSFMNENFFKHINIRPENTFLPDGMAANVVASCHAYEAKIAEFGGIDLQVLGIGANGHIAFNEPGSSLGSRTRIKTLTEETRKANSRFFGSLDEVPRYAITMGIGTIMQARRILLMASGEGKAGAIAAAIEGPLMAMVPATALQMHPWVTAILDRAAAGKLTGTYFTEPHRLIGSD